MRKTFKWARLSFALLAVMIVAACEVSIDTDSWDKNMASAAKLQGTAWWVEDILGDGVVDSSHTTIHFYEPGLVSGDSGCNRYSGSVEIGQGMLSFGPLAGTRKACEMALMAQESAFYKAVGVVVTWEIPETGLLHLKDADGEDVLRAWRIEEPNQP